LSLRDAGDDGLDGGAVPLGYGSKHSAVVFLVLRHASQHHSFWWFSPCADASESGGSVPDVGSSISTVRFRGFGQSHIALRSFENTRSQRRDHGTPDWLWVLDMIKRLYGWGTRWKVLGDRTEWRCANARYHRCGGPDALLLLLQPNGIDEAGCRPCPMRRSGRLGLTVGRRDGKVLASQGGQMEQFDDLAVDIFAVSPDTSTK